MDMGLGMLMDVLKQNDLEDSSMVIFMSDNGAPFINSKTTLYDAGVKLPLVIRCPGMEAGVVNPNLVSFIDILPTSLDFSTKAGPTSKLAATSSSPPRLGHSVLPILTYPSILPADKWQPHVFGSHTFHEIQNYYPTRFLRTHRFKYHRNIAHRLQFPFGTDLAVSNSWEGIRNSQTPVMIGPRSLTNYLFRGPEELFDLQTDPHEVMNLAGDEAFKEVLECCRAEVEKW